MKVGDNMPLVSSFYGMKVYIYYDDHYPPHFHVLYDDKWYMLSMNGDIIKGDKLPPKASKMIKEWAFLHESELYDNWDRAHSDRELKKIEPLR